PFITRVFYAIEYHSGPEWRRRRRRCDWLRDYTGPGSGARTDRHRTTDSAHTTTDDGADFRSRHERRTRGGRRRRTRWPGRRGRRWSGAGWRAEPAAVHPRRDRSGTDAPGSVQDASHRRAALIRDPASRDEQGHSARSRNRTDDAGRRI